MIAGGSHRDHCRRICFEATQAQRRYTLANTVIGLPSAIELGASTFAKVLTRACAKCLGKPVVLQSLKSKDSLCMLSKIVCFQAVMVLAKCVCVHTLLLHAVHFFLQLASCPRRSLPLLLVP